MELLRFALCIAAVLAPAVAGSDDGSFAVACQLSVVSGAAVMANITNLQKGAAGFISTKPTLQLHNDSAGTYANINIVTTIEQTAPTPFSHVLAVKMKNRMAVSSGRLADISSCADLHAQSLAAALAELGSEERKDYGVRTKRLQFDADMLWHTGLWAVEGRLTVAESSHEIRVVAPRFYSDFRVPFNLGGMMYCRLLPPSAIRDWIRGQLANSSRSEAVLV
mmetsp:Transcript_58756/g.129104  ORF Transcript_58756/g.129104 Transcript_58756/m.129104 type:complete len:222 (+) Transcript_58756:54-719(+)